MPTIIDLSHIDCVSYGRVSTEQQAGERQTSLADQDAATTQLAAKLGRSIGHRFRDPGFSGATIDQRPAMQSLIASCEAHPKTKRHQGYVLVLNDSRWGRFPNSEEATYWRVHLALLHWSVRFAEGDDVQDPITRPVLRAITQAQATLYRDTLRANTLRGTKGTAEQGYWQARAPFGFLRKGIAADGRERTLGPKARKAADEKVVLIPHPTEAPIVKALFERYASGTESINSLLDWAIEQFPARRWTRAAMRVLLMNPAYVGDVVWGRMPNERDDRGKKSWRPDAEWYGKPNAHEALISRSLFDRVQRVLAHNKGRTKGVRSRWLLSGIVQCRCGAGYVSGGYDRPRTGRKRPIMYYHCSTHTRPKAHRCAYRGTVAKWMLEDAVLSTLAHEIGTALHRRQMAAALDRAAKAAKQSARTVEHIDRDVELVRQKQARLLAAIENDTVSMLDARDRMQALRAETRRLTIERESLLSRQSGEGLPDTDKEQLIALAMDFRATARVLEGPALRELIRPWIRGAVFDTTTRELTMEIRRIPAVLGSPIHDLSSSGTDGNQKADRYVTRRVRVVAGAEP